MNTELMLIDFFQQTNKSKTHTQKNIRKGDRYINIFIVALVLRIMHIPKVIKIYTLNVYNFEYQLYLNKVFKKH